MNKPLNSGRAKIRMSIAPQLVISALFIALITACQPSHDTFQPSPQQIAKNNQGVALMGQYNNEAARQVFAQLLAEQPDWTDVEVNLAIATLNRQQPDDELRALDIVENILIDHPEHLRARYIAALMRFYIGQSDEALAHFEVLIERVPDDAHVAYFTAQTLGQLGSHEAALVLYQRSIELDPYLRSAYYGAALTHRQLGAPELAREQLAIYQRFANNPRAQLAEFRYTRKGVLAEALAIGDLGAEQRAPKPSGPVFAAPQQMGRLDLETVTSLTTADINQDGQQDLFISGGEGQGNEVWLADGPSWRHLPHALSEVLNLQATAWGDIDNDGELDVYVCREGANELRKASDGTIHPASGSVNDAGLCRDVAISDADHDGDLDIFVVNADGPNELFSNNLNGSFRRLSEEPEASLGMADHQSVGVLMVDLDADRDLDILVIHVNEPHEVWINDRLWQYQTNAAFQALLETPMVAVVAGDLDADGQVDLVSLDQRGVLMRWAPNDEGKWVGQEAGSIAGFQWQDGPSTGLALMDFTGDGTLNLLAHHRGGFAVYEVDVNAGAFKIIEQVSASIHALMPLVNDAATGPGLMGLIDDNDADGADGLALMWWPAGSGRYGFLTLDPSGKSSVADGMRSNASGLGTQVIARVGQRWTILDRLDDHSGPGQSLQPLALGLGGAEFADFVKLYWSDGVLQTEMALAKGEHHRIEEFQRQLASCPVIFAWNGERFDFVSDILGVGGIGFFQSPGQYAEPRPWEYFRFPEGTALPKEGRYPIKITEPMQEIAYIDTTRLHLYDLPKGWSVAMDERMFTGGGPEPDGSPIFYQHANTSWPIRVINDRGQDVVAAVKAVDGVAADPGERDRRFLGRLANDHVMELDFGGIINPIGSRPVLWASGWVEYPYSQTVFAAWQAGADYRPPTLSAFHDGQWSLVYEQFGYPAGMPREMTLPLMDLPANTTKLRIEGNWEVYWDAVAIIEAEPMPPETMVHVLTPLEARLAKTGFARRDTLEQRRPYYDYDDRSAFWDTHYQSGYYTALGPVMELVEAHNNAFVIVGPGEELHLEFDAPKQYTEGERVVVLETRGYAKDKDLYTLTGETVGPLPYTPGIGDRGERDRLHDRYMTRYKGGF